MQIHGLSKLTLLDYPEHMACTVFTGACNFRCPYCHNAPLVLNPDSCPVIPEEEVFDFLAGRKGILEGVCITGGEPTLQADLLIFMKKIKDLGYKVKLDTNGYRPEVVEEVIKEGLADMFAIDIKNDKEKYPITCGILNDKAFETERISKSIELLKTSGIAYEFRTTVMKELHDAERVENLAEWIAKTGGGNAEEIPYFLQNFKSSDGLVCGNEDAFHSFTEAEMKELLEAACKWLPKAKIRGEGR
ncbi:MAG: anaerobic ribonucleoside-triphosphate reductase activating protein [Lachnospiraceae bacterium]|nr:anaerobic ribonucleoside-triphosphate reductase activating protein [Lachnospiraceae bacterium]